ncbi:hypothetical protein EV421DRAFT_1731098 [Armillaria borealis]|uniref:Uncharacterized protein n=1 Tax=Armillaria borealis TaxID=47425 RepID=A0AA39K194_9AGAR|nr:hypothetical protein EV421DRAFT_1731098 [Armillaria borealis]
MVEAPWRLHYFIRFHSTEAVFPELESTSGLKSSVGISANSVTDKRSGRTKMTHDIGDLFNLVEDVLEMLTRLKDSRQELLVAYIMLRKDKTGNDQKEYNLTPQTKKPTASGGTASSLSLTQLVTTLSIEYTFVALANKRVPPEHAERSRRRQEDQSALSPPWSPTIQNWLVLLVLGLSVFGVNQLTSDGALCANSSVVLHISSATYHVLARPPRSLAKTVYSGDEQLEC